MQGADFRFDGDSLKEIIKVCFNIVKTGTIEGKGRFSYGEFSLIADFMSDIIQSINR